MPAQQVGHRFGLGFFRRGGGWWRSGRLPLIREGRRWIERNPHRDPPRDWVSRQTPGWPPRSGKPLTLGQVQRSLAGVDSFVGIGFVGQQQFNYFKLVCKLVIAYRLVKRCPAVIVLGIAAVLILGQAGSLRGLGGGVDGTVG